MRKSLKLMALGLAIIPSALVLTACGGSENEGVVDTSGDFTAVETSAYESVLTELDGRGFNLDNMLGGLQVSLGLDAKMDINGQSSTITITSDSYMKNNSQEGTLDINEIDVSSYVNMNMTSVSAGTTATLSAVLNQYITDGKQYVDLSQAQAITSIINSSVGTPIPEKLYQNLATGTESDVAVIPDYSLLTLLEIVPEGSWGEGIILEKYETETEYKVRATVKGEYIVNLIETQAPADFKEAFKINSMDDVVIYIVYSNNTFVGATLTASIDAKVTMQVDEYTTMPIAISGSIEANILPFAGEIEYPTDLNDYVLYDTSVEVTPTV
mgnify:FL=1